jgi:hypothetical protein
MKIFIAVAVIVLVMAGAAFAGTWTYKAQFYGDNYPDVSSNEKAMMIVHDMKEAGDKAVVKKKTYRVTVIHVYDPYTGEQLWPVNTKKRDNFVEIQSR